MGAVATTDRRPSVAGIAVSSAASDRPVPGRPTRLFHADVMRVAAAGAVVVLHVSATGVERYGAIDATAWWVCNIADAACRWAVPVFVMLSGALLLDRDRSLPLAPFYRRRFTRIGIPLVFWTAVYWSVLILVDPERHYLTGQFRWLLLGKPYSHLHFLFIIGGLYLVTPYLRPLVTALGPRRRLALAAILLALAAMQHTILALAGAISQPTAVSRFVPYIGYYVAGLALAHVVLGRRAVVAVGVVAVVAIAVTAAAMGAQMAYPDTRLLKACSYDFLSPNVIVLAVSVFLIARTLCAAPRADSRWAGLLGRHLAPVTFGIYLVHPLVVLLLRRAGITCTTPNVWLGLPLCCALVLVCSYLVTAAVRAIPLLRRVMG